MVKKTMTYENYDGVKITEDFYFNLTKAELVELEAMTPGGLANKINRITQTVNAPEIMSLFKTLIMKAYGEKSEDGKRLIKSEALSKAFTETEAYSDLFMELVTDAEAGAKFIQAIIPKIEQPSIPAPADK